MRKFSVACLTLIVINCKTAVELQKVEDIIYFIIEQYPKEYTNAEISTIFTVMDGKKTLF